MNNLYKKLTVLPSLYIITSEVERGEIHDHGKQQ